jgi:dipeptidyl aminopeptidase/acylaminoacyl peptidase
MQGKLRLLGAFLLVCLFFSFVTPLQAAILPVEPRNPPITLLDRAETQKIIGLSAGLIQPFSVSSPSPDGSYALFNLLGGQQVLTLNILNLKDGSIRRLPGDKLELLNRINISEVRWLDDDTFTYLTFTPDFKTAMLIGSVSKETFTFRTFDLPGIPLTLAPNGKTFILLVPPSGLFNFSLADVETYFPAVSKLPNNYGQSNPYDQRLFKEEDPTLRISATNLSLVAFDYTTKSVQPLYDYPLGYLLLGFNWASNGSKFSLTRTLLPSVGRTGNLLNSLGAQDALGQIPPAENPMFLTNSVDIVDFNTGKATPAALTAPKDAGADTFGSTAWSPDGNTLIAQLNRPAIMRGRPHPVYYPQFAESSYFRFYDSNLSPLATLERSEIDAGGFNAVPTLANADEFILQTVRGTNQTLFYYNRATTDFRALPIPPGTINQFSVVPQSRQIIFTHSSFTSRPELYTINFDGTGFKPLTENNAPLGALDKVQANEVNFTLKNGQRRTGYLLQPAGAAFPPKNEPVIVWQEGGPLNPYLNQWATNVENPFNLLPNFGFNVLFVPLPGRVGFGADFLKDMAQDDNFGKLDIDEMAEIVNQMIDTGYTAKGKIGITGCSYGGYFASQSITRHPDLYTAANTQCTLLDLFQEWQFGFTPVVFYLMGRTPAQDPAEYIKDSPLYNGAKVKAATLIFHGTLDFLDIRIAANFHDAIQANGTAVNMYAYNRMGHGLGSLSAQVSAAQLQIDWFRKYLAR